MSQTPSPAELSPLARIVTGNFEREDAIRITDFLFRSPDISDCFLVVGDGENAVVNTGSTGSGDKHRSRFRRVSEAPTRYVLLTQSHLDHIGGLDELSGPSTEIVTTARFPEIFESRRQLAAFWQRRKDFLLGPLLGDRMVNEFVEPVTPDVTFDKELELSVGGRRLQLIATPGGETLDGMCIWLPDAGLLMTGNNFGPIIGDLPNLYTIRGERIRSARGFIAMIDTLLRLEPELVVQGHDPESNLDGDSFRAIATRVRDAVASLHDQVVDGMNAGTPLRELMATVALPAELAVPQRHGRVPWCVRAIWEEYVGWFAFESTTELYEVPAKAVHPDLVELAGGPDALVGRARAHLDDGRPLEAIHLAEIALSADAEHRAAHGVLLDAHELILARTGNENFFEGLWLKGRIAEERGVVDG